MSRIHRFALALVVVALLLSAIGCSSLPFGGKLTSVSDPKNVFHFKIPDKWQAATDAGFISVYAGRKLPAEGEKPKELSVLVFSAAEASDTPVAEMVDYLVDARAEARGWKSVKPGKGKKVSVGGREGYALDVIATGADGAEFESRYIFVRTGGKEVFYVAIAPAGDPIADYDEQIADMTKEWFWHIGESDVVSPGAVQTETIR